MRAMKDDSQVPQKSHPTCAVRASSSLLSVVVPCLNEEEVLQETARRLVSVLEAGNSRFELIFVDDGSTDETPDLLRELQETDSRVRVMHLPRNFGHQVAITAGLEHSVGDAVVVIDADLQDISSAACQQKLRVSRRLVYTTSRSPLGQAENKACCNRKACPKSQNYPCRDDPRLDVSLHWRLRGGNAFPTKSPLTTTLRASTFSPPDTSC